MRRAAVLLALVAAVTVAGPARADGDPASDYLLSQQVFFPFSVKYPESRQKQLAALIKDANDRGYTIRVAVIANKSDLGAVTSLWGQPRTYAHFLGQELAFLYKGPLLVVMPAGLGFNHTKHTSTAEYMVLKKVPKPQGTDGLIDAAELAVQKLAAAHGVTVAPQAASGGGRSYGTIAVIAGAVAVILAAAALALWLRRRRNFSPAS
jgi:hypothetical protein